MTKVESTASDEETRENNVVTRGDHRILHTIIMNLKDIKRYRASGDDIGILHMEALKNAGCSESQFCPGSSDSYCFSAYLNNDEVKRMSDLDTVWKLAPVRYYRPDPYARSFPVGPDARDLATLNALKANVLTVFSAGNDGEFGLQTIARSPPWSIVVASCTSRRKFTSRIELTTNLVLPDKLPELERGSNIDGHRHQYQNLLVIFPLGIFNHHDFKTDEACLPIRKYGNIRDQKCIMYQHGKELVVQASSNAFNVLSGTSFASPHVAAALAIIMVENKFSVCATISAAITTADKMDGKDKLCELAYGAGLFNFKKAMQPGLVYDESYETFEDQFFAGETPDVFRTNFSFLSATFPPNSKEWECAFFRKLKSVEKGRAVYNGRFVIRSTTLDLPIHSINITLEPSRLVFEDFGASH